MAKIGNVSAFQRHVEKGVVALCALILLYAVLQWALGSPREVDVFTGRVTETVPPDRVDEQLNQAAEAVRERVARAEPDRVVIPDYVSILIAMRNPPVGEAMADLAPPRPPLQDIRPEVPEGKVPTVGDLAKLMPAPTQPDVWAGAELPRRNPPADEITAHAAAVYPRDELIEKWNRGLFEAGIDFRIVVTSVEVEIRELGPDGEPTEARPASTVRLPLLDRQGEPIDFPTVRRWSVGQDPTETQRDIATLADAGWQEEILQPAYWTIWWPTQEWGTWRIHLPETEVSLALGGEGPGERRVPAGEEEFQLPEGAEFVEPEEGEPSTPRRTPPARRRRTPDRGPTYPPGEFGEMSAAEMSAMEAEMRRAAEMGEYGGMPGEARPTRRPRTSERPTVLRPSGEDVEAIPVETPTPVPSLEQQYRSGKVLVWWHDNSLQPLKRYQYRVRLRLLNPLYTRDEVARSTDDAQTVDIATPYSEWSEPFSVRPTTEFFVRGSNPFKQTVRVTVFARSLGQVVKEDFTVGAGYSIGETATVEVVNPAGGRMVRVPVDFSTGAVAVDIDFDKRIRTPTITKETVELLYLDQEGVLKSRTLASDEASERLRELLRASRRSEEILARP